MHVMVLLMVDFIMVSHFYSFFSSFFYNFLDCFRFLKSLGQILKEEKGCRLAA